MLKAITHIGLILTAALLISGCTIIRAPNVLYVSILQTKTLGAEWADETGHARRINYNTQADPAVEALATITATAAKASAIP